MKKTNLRLIITVLLSAVIIPLVNIILIGSLRISFSSDVMVPEWIAAAMHYLTGCIDLACVFACYACLAYSLITREGRLITLICVGLCAPLAYLASGLVDVMFFGTQVISPAYLLYSANSTLYELLRFGAAVLILCICSSLFKRKEIPRELSLFSLKGSLCVACIVSTAVIAISILISNAAETITLIMEYGAPINATETISLISPYITTVIFTILGYFLSYGVMRLINGKSQSECTVENSADQTA